MSTHHKSGGSDKATLEGTLGLSVWFCSFCFGESDSYFLALFVPYLHNGHSGMCSSQEPEWGKQLNQNALSSYSKE
jgi:hypothetical protein